MAGLFGRRGRSRLPPGHRWIDHILGWGVEHPGITPRLPRLTREEWSLEVGGLVENPCVLTFQDLMAFPQVEVVGDFHCVETWSVKDQEWRGVAFTALMEKVGPKRGAHYALFTAYDGYTTSLPLGELSKEGVLLAHTLNGQPLPQPLGGPVRLVVPHKLGYKSIMWLRRVEFSKTDKLGFWEARGYNNHADPWRGAA